MASVPESLIIEYTEYVRPFLDILVKRAFPELTKSNYFIFNGGIINCFGDYYLLTARVIVPTCNEFMNHAEIPTMWGAVNGVRKCYGWHNILDQGMVLLLQIKSFKEPPVVINSRLMTTMHSNEDPRLYRKANGGIYMCTTTSYRPCNLLPDKRACSYMTEYELTLSDRTTFNDNVFDIIFSENKTVVCRNIVESIDRNDIFVKNLSHWTLDGIDYYTDYSTAYAPYTIYAQNGETCNTVKVSNEETCFKTISKCFQLTYNVMKPDATFVKLNLLNFNGTTPSIRVPQSMIDAYFPNVNFPLFCGVAHIRMQTHPIVANGLFNATQEILIRGGTNTLYSDVANFLAQSHERKINDELYELPFPETYLMMLYFFRGTPDENGNIGRILYTSDIFYPMAVSPQGTVVTKYNLVFPVGLMFAGREIAISYGEGDIKLFVMLSNLETLGLNPTNCGNITMRLKNIPIQSINRPSNFITTQKVSSLLENMYALPPGFESS